MFGDYMLYHIDYMTSSEIVILYQLKFRDMCCFVSEPLNTGKHMGV